MNKTLLALLLIVALAIPSVHAMQYHTTVIVDSTLQLSDEKRPDKVHSAEFLRGAIANPPDEYAEYRGIVKLIRVHDLPPKHIGGHDVRSVLWPGGSRIDFYAQGMNIDDFREVMIAQFEEALVQKQQRDEMWARVRNWK